MKQGGFWHGLECISSGAALMSDWQRAFGSAMDMVRPFLRPTGKVASSYPCPARPPCECLHEVRETGLGLVAVCLCGPGVCDTYVVQPTDLVVYGLDRERLATSLRRALGLGEVSAAPYSTARVQEIGVGPVRAPVYFSCAEEEALLRELEKLFAVRDGPLILLTPTGWACSQEVDSALRRVGGAHVPLAAVLADCHHDGELFKPRPGIEEVWREFERRAASGRDNGGTLRSIHREIATVRSEFVELRSAKQRLEKMLADGLFAFTRKVDPGSFKVLCCVLAEGDVAKASRTLGMADGSVRTIMRRWRGMGKEYRAMLDLVRWRKAVGRKETVALNDNVLLGKAATEDYPGVVADVLEKVTEMTGDNWQEKAEELEEMLRVMS